MERLGTLTERYFRGSTVDELVAGPGGINQVAGIATISLGATQIAKGSGGVALNVHNLVDAWNDRPASLPNSRPRLVAEAYAPSSQSALAAADIFDIGTDLLSLKAPVGGYYNSVGTFVRQNSMEVSNWTGASKSIEGLPFLAVAAPGTSLTTAANVLGTFGGAASSAIDWASGSACTICGNAAGGFLIYPNKPNTNQIQSVYQK